MSKVQQWKPDAGVEREQTITRNQYYEGRKTLPSTHTFEPSKEDPSRCFCGRTRRVHLLSEAI